MHPSPCRMQALLQRVRQSPPAVAGLLLQLGSTLCVSLMSIVAKLAGQVRPGERYIGFGNGAGDASPAPSCDGPLCAWIFQGRFVRDCSPVPVRSVCLHPCATRSWPLQLGLPVMELVLARSLVLLAVSAGALARQGPAARWPWHSAR